MNATKKNQAAMFLPGVEANPQHSTYFDLIQAARTSGAEYWQIWHLLAFQPEAARNLVGFSHTIMHEASPLSVGLRELIAAYTSALNQCDFCMKAHADVAAHIYKDEAFVWGVIRDLDTSGLDKKEKSLLHFVRKVTLDSTSITAGDTQSLRDIGWKDAAIFYAISACALFNFYNRWVSACGVQLVSDEVFRKLALPISQKGYLRK